MRERGSMVRSLLVGVLSDSTASLGSNAKLRRTVGVSLAQMLAIELIVWPSNGVIVASVSRDQISDGTGRGS